MILLVSSKGDLTSDYLVKQILKRGEEVFRFNTEDYPSKYSLTISLAADREHFLLKDLIDGTQFNEDSLAGAYFRKPMAPQLALHDQEAHLEEFACREATESLRSLWRCIDRQRWLNHPEDIWLASNKIKQLIVARDIGFKIPQTLVSSDAAATSDFISELNSPVITKAVSHGYSEDRDSVSIMFTTALSEAEVSEIEAATRIVPSIIQPQLDKLLDLRITVVGEHVFSAALHSQEHVETEVDWRTSSLETRLALGHSIFQLPKKLEESCVELNARLNLRFSCIDMVLTRQGDYYFLETNPNGEWAWIEETLGYPISESMLDLLAA